ncbi:hypothetical protein WME94_52495 [Sorangium sp. So ce429]
MHEQHHRYQEQDSTQTLREGLEEYHQNALLYKPTAMTPSSKRFFKAHDACHVVFGCSTTPEQEALIDVWTMFGTTWQWSEYLGEVERPDQKQRILGEIIPGVGYGRMALLVLFTLPGCFTVYKRTQEMHQKWGMYEYEPYLDTTLKDIRKKYNIRVCSSEKLPRTVPAVESRI